MLNRGFIFVVLLVLVLGGVFSGEEAPDLPKALSEQGFVKAGDYYEWTFGEDKTNKE